MSFDQYCQEAYLETRSYGWAYIANIVNDFQPLTISAEKDVRWVLNRPWAIMSEAYLECSQKAIVDHFCENS